MKKEQISLIAKMQHHIPIHYGDFYPETRKMHRTFFLHYGPTNSGKTWESMNALKKASCGVYLAPLRLLAYEKFEELNASGCICSMITGEEETILDGATHISSTIEVLDFTKEYDVAVIDECQMIYDKTRGNAWTQAILGIKAKEIHLCFSPECKASIQELIVSCGDSYQEVEHKRKTPLIINTQPFVLEKKDALIVFSRRSVHALAAELTNKGHSCSIIYGNLPYKVRQKEVHRFLDGKTDYLISTDAIAMGLNLPIRRVVFAETKKFDGQNYRELLPEEIRQIAGRAGRFGIYDQGFVTSIDISFHEKIKKALHPCHECENDVVIGFPKSLMKLDEPLSQLMTLWNEIPEQSGFRKEDLKDKIKKIKIVENLTKNRNLISFFSNINFHSSCFDEWVDFSKQVIKKGKMKWTVFYVDKNTKLENLEYYVNYYNLVYQIAKRTQKEDIPKINELREELTKRIAKKLAKNRFTPKRCSCCRKKLPWNYSYSLCEDCYTHRYNQWYDWY